MRIGNLVRILMLVSVKLYFTYMLKSFEISNFSLTRVISRSFHYSKFLFLSFCDVVSGELLIFYILVTSKFESILSAGRPGQYRTITIFPYNLVAYFVIFLPFLGSFMRNKVMQSFLLVMELHSKQLHYVKVSLFEDFLVRIFAHSGRIQNRKRRIRTLFTQCILCSSTGFRWAYLSGFSLQFLNMQPTTYRTAKRS